MELKDLTASMYTFEKLIEGDYLYVDKTEYIWKMIKPACGIYFLSRPRRFGKSLTLSTLKAVFQNKRHLFKGLALDTKQFEWKEHPIIHLDFGSCPAATAPELEVYLVETLDALAADFGLALTRTGSSARFAELVALLAKRGQVVILIDEYDKPILDNITSPEVEAIRSVMENLYSVVKTTEAHQRFVLLTGVSKFAKVSVFSRLNNLADLSMDERFATALGYTQEELEANFAPYLDQVAERRKLSRGELLDKLRLWYNGYRFHPAAATVYNPVSIAKFLDSGGEFENYWFETGTPRFLIELLKKNDYDLGALETTELGKEDFSSYEIDSLQVLPLLFQTGYLTIAKAREEDESWRYTLGFPNREVRESFNHRLAQSYSALAGAEVSNHLVALRGALRSGDLDKFFESLAVFFSKVPYDIQLRHERYYQTIFHVVFTLIGVNMASEVRTNKGRVDAVVEAGGRVYLFEFKLDGSADAALEQIRTMEYFRRYQGSGKKLVLVGASFDSRSRGVSEWKQEPLDA